MYFFFNVTATPEIYTVEPALRQRLLDIEHERFWFGEAGRLDDDDVGPHARDDLVNRRLEFPQQRAANATATKLGDAYIFSFDHFRVDRDLAEFVHHYRDLRRALRKNVTKYRPF